MPIIRRELAEYFVFSFWICFAKNIGFRKRQSFVVATSLVAIQTQAERFDPIVETLPLSVRIAIAAVCSPNSPCDGRGACIRMNLFQKKKKSPIARSFWNIPMILLPSQSFAMHHQFEHGLAHALANVPIGFGISVPVNLATSRRVFGGG